MFKVKILIFFNDSKSFRTTKKKSLVVVGNYQIVPIVAAEATKNLLNRQSGSAAAAASSLLALCQLSASSLSALQSQPFRPSLQESRDCIDTRGRVKTQDYMSKQSLDEHSGERTRLTDFVFTNVQCTLCRVHTHTVLEVNFKLINHWTNWIWKICHQHQKKKVQKVSSIDM